MKNKKAVELNVNTIIVVILAVLVLVVLFLSFTGGMTKMWEQISSLWQPSKEIEVSNAISTCNLYLGLPIKSSFCCSTQNVQKYGEVTCKALGEKLNWEGFNNPNTAMTYCDDYECPEEETEE